MRSFAIAGPVKPLKHYYIPHRLDEKNIKKLIKQQHYFVLHAPRQSGKTTGIEILVRQINEEGEYKALYVNVESAQASRGDFIKSMKTIVDSFARYATQFLQANDSIFNLVKEISKNITGDSLAILLQDWSKTSEKPIVLVIDEIDSLVGDTLISILRQIRSGYSGRPEFFPQAICLVGVRDVRDYRIWSDSEQSTILGGSAFNIKAESFTLENFSREQVANLYFQHTQETGQKFTQEAIDYAYELTQGQPWLTNMLGYQACLEDPLMTDEPGTADASKIVTKEVIERAKETIIRRRDTHIDVLIARLQEERVAKIIDAIINGEQESLDVSQDDIQYVLDLGLLIRKDKQLVIANPIYQEIIPREIGNVLQDTIVQKIAWYQSADGSLDMQKLMPAIQQFFRENGDIWESRNPYKEAAPHIILMAFLQRVINGGGRIYREYALGRKRVDLLIEFGEQRIVVELKLFRGKDTLTKGLEQTKKYMEISNATEGHLVIFDRLSKKLWDERIYHKMVEGLDVWGA